MPLLQLGGAGLHERGLSPAKMAITFSPLAKLLPSNRLTLSGITCHTTRQDEMRLAREAWPAASSPLVSNIVWGHFLTHTAG